MPKEPYEISLWNDVKRKDGVLKPINLTFPYRQDEELKSREDDRTDQIVCSPDNTKYLDHWVRSTYAAQDRIYHGGNEDGYARIERAYNTKNHDKEVMLCRGFARDDSFYNRLDTVATYEVEPDKDKKEYVFNGIKAGDMYVFRYRAGYAKNITTLKDGDKEYTFCDFEYSPNLFLRPIIAPAQQGVDPNTGELNIIINQQEGDAMLMTRSYQSMNEWDKGDYMQCILIAQTDIPREAFIGFNSIQPDPIRIEDNTDYNPYRLWIKIQPQMKTWGRYYDEDDPLHGNENANSKFLIKDFAIEYMEFFKMEVDEDGNIIEPSLDFKEYPNVYKNRYQSWFEEEKFCVIGSDTMESTSRATEPKLERDNKGQNTLSFKMYTRCHDNGEDYENPFLPYIYNESKIKCKWQDKWYDFVVKDMQRDSSNKSVTVTCKDQYINELSRTGFDITMNTELENNMGTAWELVENALEHSEWELDKENSEQIQQKTTEKVFRVKALKDIEVAFDREEGIEYSYDDPRATIKTNDEVLLFYSIPTSENPCCSFLFNKNKKWVVAEEGKQLVFTGSIGDYVCAQYSFDCAEYKWVDDANIWVYQKGDNDPTFKINISTDVAPDLQGARLVRKQISEYDKLTERYVEVFEQWPNLQNSSMYTIADEQNNYFITDNDYSSWQTMELEQEGKNLYIKCQQYGDYENILAPEYGMEGNQGTKSATAIKLENADNIKTNSFYIPTEFLSYLSISWNIDKNKKGQGIIDLYKDLYSFEIQKYKSNYDFSETTVWDFKDHAKAAQEIDYIQIDKFLTIKGIFNKELEEDESYYLIIYTDNKNWNKSGTLVHNYSTCYDITFRTKKEFNKIHKYTKTQTYDTTIIQNLITNPTNFASTDGWYYVGDGENGTPIIVTKEWTDEAFNKTFNPDQFLEEANEFPWLRIGSNNSGDYIYNPAMSSIPSTFKDGIKQGDKYILRLCAAALPARDGIDCFYPDEYDYKKIKDSKLLDSKTTLPFNRKISSWIEPQICSFNIRTLEVDQYDSAPVDPDSIKVKSNFSEPYQSTKQTLFFLEDEEGVSWEDQGFTWIEYEFESDINIPAEQLTGFMAQDELGNKPTYYGLFFKLVGNHENHICIQNIEFFRKIEDENANTSKKEAPYIEPDWIDTKSVLQTTYYYYDYTDQVENKEITKFEDLAYLYTGTKDWESSSISPKYNETEDGEIKFLAISSIEAKQSNHYNILQSIAEKFQCYLEFNIEHEENGSLKYDETMHRPRKTVKIKRTQGNNTGLSFIYGLDLKSIKRSIKSDQLTTKTYVLQNSNEFGENGFCAIGRSPNNYSGEDYILNFDYYVERGIIDAEQLTKDLYLPSGGYMGYYIRAKYYNDLIYNYGQYLEQKITSYQVVDEKHKLLQEYLTEARTQVTNSYKELSTYANVFTNWKYPKDEWKEAKGDDNLVDWMGTKKEPDDLYKWAGYWYTNAPSTNEMRRNIAKQLFAIATLKRTVQDYSKKTNIMSTEINSLKIEIDNLQNMLQSLRNSKKELYYQFNQKYLNFIQEGQWSSDDYYDDTLYYFEGMNVAYESSRPKVEYTFDVLRLSSLEGFELKRFDINDYAFIEDKEFFGNTTINGVITPWKEKVVLSGMTYNFDSPSKDTFKVQNYRTQFEDLFQQTIATVQSLKYAQGNYNRAASSFATNGTIMTRALQASLNQSMTTKIASQNGQTQLDATGFFSVNPLNAGNQIKQFGGNLCVTTNGGGDWVNYDTIAHLRSNSASQNLIENAGVTKENIDNMDY